MKPKYNTINKDAPREIRLEYSLRLLKTLFLNGYNIEKLYYQSAIYKKFNLLPLSKEEQTYLNNKIAEIVKSH